MDKYLTPSGTLVEGSVLRSKYGDRFDELVSNGTLKLQPSEELQEEKYVTPNGSVLNEDVLRSKYGEKFEGLVSQGTLKKKDDSVLPSGVGSSVQPTQDSDVQTYMSVSPGLLPTVEYITSNEKATAIERALGKNTITDFLGDIYRSSAQGVTQGATIDEALTVFGKGSDASDEELEDFISEVGKMDSMPVSDEMNNFSKTYEENGSGILGFVLGVGENPSVIPQIFTSSVAAMVNPTVAAGAGAGALAGAGAGAALGATGGPLAGITAAGGSIAGAIGGMTGVLETGLSYTEFLKEEIESKGLEFNKESIREVLSDEESLSRIRNKALARGISIGAIDALSGGLASKVTRGVATKIASKAAGAVAGGAVEAIGGSVGEATARAVTGQEMDIAEIGFEGVAGTATAPITTARGILKSPVYKIGDQVVSRGVIQDVVDTSTPEQIAAINFEVNNDPDFLNQIQEKKQDAILSYKIKTANPEVSAEDNAKILELEKTRQSLIGNDTRGAKNKLASIERQIDDITEKYTAPTKVETTKQEAVDALLGEGITEPTDAQVIEKLDELNKEKLDAIQEPSTEEISVQDQPRVSEEVVEEVSIEEEPAQEGEGEVSYSLPEDPFEAANDFEIIDNRKGKADLEINGKEGNWYVRNKVTDKIVATTSKKEAQSLIDNPDWDYGEGDTIVQVAEQTRDFVTTPSIKEPFILTSPSGRPSNTQVNFTEDGKVESIVNKKTGNEVTAATKSKAEKRIIDTVLDVDSGEKAELQEGMTPDQVISEIADNSNNIREVAEAIKTEEKSVEDKKSQAGEVLSQEGGLFGLAGEFFTPDSWKRASGISVKEMEAGNPGFIKTWIRTKKKRGQSIEDGAKGFDASEIVKFIETYPTASKLRESAGQEQGLMNNLDSLKERFTFLTGIQATPTNIEAALNVEEGRKPTALLEQESMEIAQMEASEPGVFGKKRGPSPKKITGEAPTMVTVDEAKALTDQIKLEARAARDARLDQNARRKSIGDKIKEMSSRGVISSPQAKAVINRLSKVNLNNEVAVNKVLDYAQKVFENAEFVSKLKQATKLNDAAKKNINKGNLGMNNSFISALSSILDIPVQNLNNQNIDEYNEFVSKFASRKRVVPLEEATELTKQANDLFEKIYEPVVEEDSETVKADNKAVQKFIRDVNSKDIDGDYILSNYSSFLETKLDRIDSPTLYNLVDKIKDSTENKELVDSVVDYAEARNKIINDALGINVKLNKINELSRDTASKYKKLKKSDLVDLTGKQLEEVIVHMNNINNGFYTYAANDLVRVIESNRRSKDVVPILSKLDDSKISLAPTRIYGKIKSKFTQRAPILESIRSNPLNVIDDVYGNFKGREISNNVFEPIASSLSKYEAQMSSILAEVTDIDSQLAAKGLESSNKETRRKYSITYYLLQKEFESNENAKGTAPASDFVDVTIDDYNSDPSKSKYNEADVEMLESINNEFKGKSADEIFNSFTPQMKRATERMQDIYRSNEDKAAWTARVVRGEGVKLINNYVHHKVSVSEESDISDRINQKNSIINPSSKSKAAISRTAGAKPIEFDPINTLMRSTRYTLLDYNLTNELKTGAKTIQKIKNGVDENPDATKLQKDGANSIGAAYNEAIEGVLLHNFSDYNFFSRVFDKARTVGYQAALASVPRAAAEFLSNLSYVLTASPKEFSLGTKQYGKWSAGQSGLDVVRNVGSKTFSKLYGEEKLSGSKAEASGLVRGMKGKARAKNKIGESFDLLSRGAKPVTKVASNIAENLIATPDKAISRPLFFGTFASEFKKITGKEVDFDKISEGDREYLIENKEAIRKAREVADVSVQRAATTNSRMDVILKNQIKPTENPASKVYKTMNSYMSRFAINEYTTARQAMASMIGSGEMTRGQGARTLIALNLRMATYLTLSQFFSAGLASMFGFGDDDEDYFDNMGRGVVGSALSLISRRTLGNAAMIPINIMIENLNEEYGSNLRSGEKYDPYKHSLVYSQVVPDRFYRDPVEKTALLMAGPYQPLAKTYTRMAKTYGKMQSASTKKQQKKYMDELISLRTATDVLGTTGLLPFYRDIRSVILAKEYNK